MKALKIATVPPPTIQAALSVKEAIPLMAAEHGCAVAVLDGERLVGTLSKDDVLARVVAAGRDPSVTRIADVMTQPAESVTVDSETSEALKRMFDVKKCYLPVVEQDGTLKGWLAICNLFRDHVEDLDRELDSLAAYLAADGPGG